MNSRKTAVRLFAILLTMSLLLSIMASCNRWESRSDTETSEITTENTPGTVTTNQKEQESTEKQTDDEKTPQSPESTNKITVTDERPLYNNWTETIQGSIDKMFLLGGGEVIIPTGDYDIGSIRLRSNVTLHLLEDAHLIASRDLAAYEYVAEKDIEPISEEDFTDAVWEPVGVRKNYDFQMKPMGRWNRAVIKALDAENIAIIGEPGSRIDGMNCFDPMGEEHYRGPHAINMHRCKNVTLKGYEIQNSSNWAHALCVCENLLFEEISVFGGHDGIHVTSCTNIVIKNCDFQTGDDCIGGIDNLNVEVLGCKLNTACNGMRFGGTNVLVHDTLFYGPAKYRFRGGLSYDDKVNGAPSMYSEGQGGTMLSAYTYYADYSREFRNTPGNIVIYNCEFRNTDRFLHYNFSGNEAWQRNEPLRDITFRNIKATGIRYALTFWGDSSLKGCLTLENANIRFADGVNQPLIRLGNYDTVILRNVCVENLKGTCLIRKWTDDGTVIIEDYTLPGFRGDLEELTDEPFVSTTI